MKKLISVLALVVVLIFSVNLCYASGPVMKDVDYETDLGKSIEKLIKAGVINGIPEADGTYTYRSNNPITRAEFCKMINATFNYGVMADNVFTDVKPGDWYYVDVLKAINYGYIKGYGDGRFGGEDLISREQVCVILDRIVGRKTDKEITITDTVSDWALESVKNIVALGYMPLEEGNTFRATENMTRGEHAQALDDFVTVPEDKKEDANKTEDTKTEDNKEESSSAIKPGSNSSGSNSSGSNSSGSNSSGSNSSGSDSSGSDSSDDTTGGGEVSEDNTAVEAVIAAIDAIGEVSLDSKEAIEAAREAYNALTTTQRSKVTNISKLTAAESALKKIETDMAMAQRVDELIDQIAGDKDLISTARARYDALTDAQKEYVTKYDVLTAAEQEISDDIYDDLEFLIDDMTIKLEEEIIVLKEETGDDGMSVYQLYNADDEPVKGGAILMMLLGASEEILPLRDEGFIISNKYVRETYAEQIQAMKVVLDDMLPEEKEAFKLELGKLNTGVILSLANIFNVNMDY